MPPRTDRPNVEYVYYEGFQDAPVRMVIMEIREELKIRNLTYNYIAEKSGIGKTNIYMYLSGKLNPKIDTLMKIADALDMNLIVCLGEKPQEEQK